MRTRRVTRKPANGQPGSRSALEDGRMGSAYLGVMAVELLVLVGLWAVGTYFSSL